jgi:hypothetical protein
MTSNTTKQFKCPVDGCYKTFNKSVSMGNHIRLMIMNGHDDHAHLMDEVNRTTGQESNQEDNKEEDELPEVDEIQPQESEPVTVQAPNPEQEDDWIKLEPGDPSDRELIEAGFTEVRKQALEKVQHPGQLEPGEDLR